MGRVDPDKPVSMSSAESARVDSVLADVASGKSEAQRPR
jgi:hypothetical protein